MHMYSQMTDMHFESNLPKLAFKQNIITHSSLMHTGQHKCRSGYNPVESSRVRHRQSVSHPSQTHSQNPTRRTGS